MVKLKNFWKKFNFFRKRYFHLRLIILFILLIYFLALSTDRMIIKLVNIAIDSIYMAGIPTVTFARDYRKIEVIELEQKILMGFDKDKNKILGYGEREKFMHDTGLLLYEKGQTFHIKATEKEIVDLADKLGYGKKSYKQITRECFEKAKSEQEQSYSLILNELNKTQMHFAAYTKIETWKRGLTQFGDNIFGLATGFHKYPNEFRRWGWKTFRFSYPTSLSFKLFGYYPTGLSFRVYPTAFTLYRDALRGWMSSFKDLKRGVVIKKIKREPGYYVR